MSNKIKVRFNYGGENTVLVNQTQKGPVDLTTLGFNKIQPVKQQVLKQSIEIAKQELFQDNLHQIIKGAQKEVEDIQSKEKQVLQKTTLNTYKSQQVISNVQNEVSPTKVSNKSTLKIEDLDETVFNKNPQKTIVKTIQKSAPKDDIPPVITAPNFKMVSKQGKPSKQIKNYTKGQDNPSYQYTNIPVKDEDQFTGCFGCMRRKPKSYSIEKK